MYLDRPSVVIDVMAGKTVSCASISEPCKSFLIKHRMAPGLPTPSLLVRYFIVMYKYIHRAPNCRNKRSIRTMYGQEGSDDAAIMKKSTLPYVDHIVP